MTDAELDFVADMIRRTPIRDDRQALRLRLAGPKRAEAGRPIAGQADAAHLPLFTAANEPRLF